MVAWITYNVVLIQPSPLLRVSLPGLFRRSSDVPQDQLEGCRLVDGGEVVLGHLRVRSCSGIVRVIGKETARTSHKEHSLPPV